MNKRFLDDEVRWADWMARAQAGDRAVYETLLAELGVAIETYIRVRFGPIDALEDCVQECLIAVHAARQTYDPRRLFRPWLFTIVRHRTIDLLRQRRTWLSMLDAFGAEAQGDEQPDRLLRQIDGVRILEQLSPDHREMIALSKYGGYTTAEAADYLGITESAAKARLLRALAAIRTLLEAEGLPA